LPSANILWFNYPILNHLYAYQYWVLLI